MLGMLRMAMPSRDVLLRSSRVPSHCRAHGQRQAAGLGGAGAWHHGVQPPLPACPQKERGSPSVVCCWTVLRANLPQGGMGSPGVAGAGGANTPQLCFSRADNHHLPFLVLLSPLFRYEFYYTFEMAVLKSEFPMGAHKTSCRLNAATQNRMQYHLGPAATSIQASPAHAFPPPLVQIDPKESGSLAAQKLTQTSLFFKCNLETRNEAGRK